MNTTFNRLFRIVSNQKKLERLSKREKEIYTYRQQGLSHRQIAEKLNLSMNTIHYYTQQIKKKLSY